MAALCAGTKLNITKLIFIFFACIVLAGCSTGRYLKPYSSIGGYSTENPACPGAERVLEFSLTNYDWIVFRVLAKQPTKYQPAGTQLIAYVMPKLYKHPEPDGSWSLFPSKAEKQIKENLISERKSQNIEITFERSSATIILSDGNKTQVELPFYQKPHKVLSDKYYGIWGPEVIISPNKLEAFTVNLPPIYINGKKQIIPPIEFRISSGKYAPVLNC